MESDSDSDGSHISATPPRQITPSQPRPTLLSSHKSRVKARIFPPISKPQPTSKANPLKAKIRSSEEDALPNPFPSADFSNIPGTFIQICRPTYRNHAVSALNSMENLPAGYFSKSASFSKIRRTSINLDPRENDPVHPSIPVPQPENGGGDRVEVQENRANHVPPEASSRAVQASNCNKSARKYPNLVVGNVLPLPSKKPKYVSEGNFVRLNINGHGHKFVSKCGKKRTSYSSKGKKFGWRSKRKSKSDGEAEINGLCDEDGLVSETQTKKRHEKSKCSDELIEEAVLAVRDEISDENIMKLMKLTHGYDSFREGQLEAIKKVLARQSTMLVLPTGSGKSLCYHLPALILPGLTLVVSPLVALMVDQLRQLPPMIPGGLLCSSQTSEETSETLSRLCEGSIKVLFVSPERFLNAEFVSIFRATLISVVVVDEAHCLSEWSHNFRPSYLRLRASLLRANFNIECFLAMTATATTKTLDTVMCALEISPTNLIQSAQIRENLQLSVKLSGNRMKDVMMLITSSPFKKIQSIIIYCKFQSETNLLSKYLCDNNISAKSYHSGIFAKDRSRTQELFCSNKIRVVVATVAFGMGLDKSDVGAVIHYSLPESLEEYVQETGRAGRDGRLSYCHLLYDDATYFKLRSLLYSDGVDEYAVNRFLCEVFSNELNSPGKICSLNKESASRKFDMKEEVMLTVLTYLELGEVQFLRLLPQLNATCILNFHKTSPVLLAGKDTLVAAILKKSETKKGHYVFDIPTMANNIGVTAIDLSNQLQQLKSKGEITYDLKDTAFSYTIVKSPGDYCSLAAQLTTWLSAVESCKVRKLDTMFNAAHFAAQVCEKKDGCSGTLHTPCLQRKILDYFRRDDDHHCNFPKEIGQSSPFLHADIKVFLQSNSHAKFTPRAVARIMHGIPSPAYPSAAWSRTHFWGRYTNIDFPAVMEAAKMELMKFVGKMDAS